MIGSRSGIAPTLEIPNLGPPITGPPMIGPGYPPPTTLGGPTGVTTPGLV